MAPPAYAACASPLQVRRPTGSIEQLLANVRIDGASVMQPPPRSIALVDMLTTGAYFVAATMVLVARFADVPIRGVFAARRVFYAIS
jgi:hypothetical protein